MITEELIQVYTQCLNEVMEQTADWFDSEEQNVDDLKKLIVKGTSEVEDLYYSSISTKACMEIYIALINHVYDLNIDYAINNDTFQLEREGGDEYDFNFSIHFYNEYEKILDSLDD